MRDSAGRFERVEQIFNEISTTEGEHDRIQLLNQLCGSDHKLRIEVEALLASQAGLGSFLHTNTCDLTEAHVSSDLAIGELVGRYKLLQKLGEGGFGVVYMAEQLEPVRRKVALKIVKPGMDSRAIVARFEAERQALAMMDHPHIAKVLDGGTLANGRPYFVMELVRGVAITEYCDKKRLAIRDRLSLLVDVCNAVQHAHQKGVIHRDLKPSNIMVTLHDGKPVTKVIDFGIAKALNQELTEKTLFTQYGQMIGTPEYMSPEQAEMSGLDIDTRSDIYSLGVVLYQLLTGTTPITMDRFRQAGYAAMQKLICEEELPKPSTRVSKSTEEQLIDLADHRSVTSVDLRREIEGDLDWIVMKSLDKERDRRYATAKDMADDVQRFLSDSPVLARPPSLLYKFRKYAKRNRGLLVAASVLAASLISCTVVSLFFAFSAQRAYRVANAERNDSLLAKAAEQKQRTIAEDQASAIALQAASLENQAKQLSESNYRLRIASAQDHIGLGDVLSARQMLDVCPENARNWEWSRLDYSAQSFEPVLEVSPKSSCFAISGQYLVTLGRDSLTEDRTSVSSDSNWVKLWNASDGTPIKQVEVEIPRLTMLAVGPEGKKLLLGGADGSVLLTEFPSMKKIWFRSVAADRIDGLSFTTDGSRCLVASWDHTISILDVADGNQLNRSAPVEDQLRGAVVAKSKNMFATANASNWMRAGEARIWSTLDGRLLKSLETYQRGCANIAFDRDGEIMVTVGEDGSARIWNTKTWNQIGSLQSTTSPAISAALNDEGTLLAIGHSSGLVTIWNFRRKSMLASFNANKAHVYWLEFADDGMSLFTHGLDKIRKWDLGVINCLELGLPHHDGVCSVAFNRSGSRLATGGANRCLTVWDLSEGMEEERVYHPDSILAVAWSPDDSMIATHCANGMVRIFDGSTKQLVHKIKVLEADYYWQFNCLSFSPDSKSLCVGSGNDVAIFDSSTAKQIALLKKHTGRVYSLALSVNGDLIATGGADQSIIIWDAEKQKPIHEINGHTSMVSCLEFSDDSRMLVSAAISEDNRMRVWDVASGQEIRSLPNASGGYIYDASFCNDNTRIVHGNEDEGTVYVSDPTNGEKLLVVPGETGAIYGVDISPNAQDLAISSINGEVRVWPVSSTSQSAVGLRPTHLAARRLFELSREKHVTQTETTSAISELPGDVKTTRLALKIGRIHGNDPYYLHKRAFETAVNPNLKNSDYEKALQWSEMSLELMPNSYHYKLAHGLLSFRLGRRQEARQELERLKLEDAYDMRARACVLACLVMVGDAEGKLGGNDEKVLADAFLLFRQSSAAACSSVDDHGLQLLQEAEAYIVSSNGSAA